MDYPQSVYRNPPFSQPFNRDSVPYNVPNSYPPRLLRENAVKQQTPEEKCLEHIKSQDGYRSFSLAESLNPSTPMMRNRLKLLKVGNDMIRNGEELIIDGLKNLFATERDRLILEGRDLIKKGRNLVDQIHCEISLLGIKYN